MRLHLIQTDDPYRPILMLSEYESADVDRLCQVCRDLAARRIERFALHEQPWINAIDHCRFFWQYCSKDIGVQLPMRGDPFVLQYSDEAWLEVQAKLSVMRGPLPNHLQDLTVEGDVSVIISPDGKP